MKKLEKYLPFTVAVIGLVGIVVGSVFVGMGVKTHNFLQTAMQQEQITLGIDTELVASGEVIDTATEAQIAGDTVREHRHGIAPTYGDLLGGERFDPTNVTQLSYAQALNLENYLYLAVASFGLTTVATYAGVFMTVTGIGLIMTGFFLYKLRNREIDTNEQMLQRSSQWYGD